MLSFPLSFCSSAKVFQASQADIRNFNSRTTGKLIQQNEEKLALYVPTSFTDTVLHKA